jgi:hypothetical protein
MPWLKSTRTPYGPIPWYHQTQKGGGQRQSALDFNPAENFDDKKIMRSHKRKR